MNNDLREIERERERERESTIKHCSYMIFKIYIFVNIENFLPLWFNLEKISTEQHITHNITMYMTMNTLLLHTITSVHSTLWSVY